MVANLFVTASALVSGRILRRGPRRVDQLQTLDVKVQTAVVAEVVATAVALAAYGGTSNVRPSAPL
jgi:hypothetical protein